MQLQFVDYGNFDEVKPWEVKELKDDFFSPPAHAFPCSLANATPTGGSWSLQAVDMFRALAEGVGDEADRPVSGLVSAQNSDGSFIVELIDRSNKTVLSSLKKHGHIATSTSNKPRAPVVTKRSVTSPPSSAAASQQREAPTRAPVVKIEPKSPSFVTSAA